MSVRSLFIWTGAILSILITLAVLGFLGYRLFGHPSHPTEWAVDPGLDLIYYDQKLDEWNWMNWLVTDWFLSLLAAGTAISAAVKNAFSSHKQANAEIAAKKAGIDAPTQKPTSIDTAVMVLAALTVIATTLDAKMHASQQADRYRRSDLILQDAIGGYKNGRSREDLLQAWYQSQRVLEGAPEVLDKDNSGTGSGKASGQPGSGNSTVGSATGEFPSAKNPAPATPSSGPQVSPKH